jgi:hypothetical protein
MVLAHAVETHAGVAAHRGGALEVRHVAGGSRRQHGQRVEATAVGGELRYLLAGDDVAHLARIRLHGDGSGFHIDAVLGIADLHLEIDTAAVADRERDTGPLRRLEAGRFHAHDILPNVKIRHHELAGIITGEPPYL